jgi:hypothetical protein
MVEKGKSEVWEKMGVDLYNIYMNFRETGCENRRYMAPTQNQAQRKSLV